MIKAYRLAGMTLLAMLVAACGITEPRTLTPGVVEAGKLRVTIDDGWYRAPSSETQEKRSSTRVLTREGIETDRLYLVGGVDDGKTLFATERAGGAAAFDASMSSADVAGLIADSLEATLWGGSATVAATNVNERGFTGIPGVQFEIEVSGPANHRGVAGAFIAEERLYAVIFVAESPDAFERFEEVALETIDSAIFSIKTIHR